MLESQLILGWMREGEDKGRVKALREVVQSYRGVRGVPRPLAGPGALLQSAGKVGLSTPTGCSRPSEGSSVLRRTPRTRRAAGQSGKSYRGV
jgi:hypothetical protein